MYITLHLIHNYTLFFFNDTATTEIYTLSLHDALPISSKSAGERISSRGRSCLLYCSTRGMVRMSTPCSSKLLCRFCRSEEHTSELQSQSNLVCRLLLEKKKIYSVSCYHINQ